MKKSELVLVTNKSEKLIIVLAFITIQLTGCVTNKLLSKAVDAELQKKNYKAEIVIDRSYLKNFSVVLYDSNSIRASSREDYKKHYTPSNEDYAWISSELSVFKHTYARHGQIKIANFNRYVIQYAGYLTDSSTRKIYVALIPRRFFLKRLSTCLRYHEYYDLAFNISEGRNKKPKIEMYGFIFELPSPIGEYRFRRILK